MSPDILPPRPLPPTVRFLLEFARALEGMGRRALCIRPRRTVAWREGVTLNHLALIRWNGRDPEAPRLTRMALNHHPFDPSRRTLLLLGFERGERFWRHEGLHLEVTVRDEELPAFAPWLALWIAGRLDPAVAIPEPPVPCHNWHRDWQTTDYAWSAAGWEAERAWRAKEDAARARWQARWAAARTMASAGAGGGVSEGETRSGGGSGVTPEGGGGS